MAEYELKVPLTEKDIRKLRIKDAIYLTGEVLTVRDSAYERILQALQSKKTLPFELKGKAIWHAGPITKQVGDRWKAVSVGSTTSGRFTVPAAQLINSLGIRLVIGKGPMGKETQEALAQSGAAYVMTTGGAAAYYANQITEVTTVHWLELGMPAAVWVFQVKRLGPLIVVMDSHGANFFDEVRAQVDLSLKGVFKDYRIDPKHNFLWWPKDKD